MNESEARSIVAEVLAGIAPEADLGAVGSDEDLRAALDLDSMDFMNFLVGLSERTGREIPDSDTPRLYTLGGLLAYLAQR